MVQEAGILARLRHPNVLLGMAYCLDPPAIITDFCKQGSLWDVIEEAGQSPNAQEKLPWLRRCIHST